MGLPPIKFPGALDLSVIGETRRAWGGLRVGGIATVATAIGADLAARLPRQNKKQREGLALLVATALDVRDVNLMELAAALPRAAARGSTCATKGSAACSARLSSTPTR